MTQTNETFNNLALIMLNVHTNGSQRSLSLINSLIILIQYFDSLKKYFFKI